MKKISQRRRRDIFVGTIKNGQSFRRSEIFWPGTEYAAPTGLEIFRLVVLQRCRADGAGLMDSNLVGISGQVTGNGKRDGA